MLSHFQASQIAQLIQDYREILAQRRSRPTSTSSSSSSEDGQSHGSKVAHRGSTPRHKPRRRPKGSSSGSPKVSPKRSPGLEVNKERVGHGCSPRSLTRDRSTSSMTPLTRRRALFRERKSTSSISSNRTSTQQFCSLLHGDSLEDMADVFLGSRGTKGIFSVDPHP